MEVIDIGLTDLEPVTLNMGDSLPSTTPSNFGMEFLMNDKVRSGHKNTSVDLGDMDSLERELNSLSSTSTKTVSSGLGSGFGNFFSTTFGSPPAAAAAPAPSMETTDSKVGAATVDAMGSTRTWDGFGKMDDVPGKSSLPKISDRELRRKKRAMLKKLDEWYEKKYVKHNSNFTMDSPYEDIEDEYESVVEEKRKKDSVKLQGWWFTTIVNSLEYANATFDPFGLNLDGWGEQISEDLDSYEEIFNELHEKYKGGKLSPEISLLLRVAFSASMVNITNKALSTATPGFNDVIRQSPELMKMFTNATAQSMKQSSPGFGFVNSILHPEEQINTSFGPPPAPLETKSMPPPVVNAGSRPDLAMGRGAMFREPGVQLNSGYDKLMQGLRPTETRPEMQGQRPEMQGQRPEMQGPRPEMQGQRPEMRGPQNVDVNSLLSGLKPREERPATPIDMLLDTGDDSMISVSSLRDAQNATLPKKTRRKQRSDKNIISLDI